MSIRGSDSKPFDKYDLYLKSVQSPDEDVQFMRQAYINARPDGKTPLTLREDFCGTFANCCAWIKLGPKMRAVGIDLDPEPLQYGMERHKPTLNAEEQGRLSILEQDVLKSADQHADVIAAMNFSYFLFKERATLLNYFKQCREALNARGVLVLDCFGGSDCQESNIEETDFADDGFTYYWDQDSFDPITNRAVFHIHYKRKGEKRRDKVFSYDWRMWSIPELRDVLLDAGFSQVQTYWEGTNEDGEGDGEWRIANVGEECQAWVSYLVALK